MRNWGVTVWAKGREPRAFFDAIVLAGHSDQMLSLLDDASPLESAILSSVEYRPKPRRAASRPAPDARRKIVWSPWNYMRCIRPGGEAEVCVTYWMNELQGIDRSVPLFRVAQPGHRAACRADLRRMVVLASPVRFRRDLPHRPASARSRTPPHLVRRRLDRFGFHEDGLRSGLDAAEGLGAVIPWRDPPKGRHGTGGCGGVG